MLQLLRLERSHTPTGVTIAARFDDPARDDGAVQYVVKGVPTDALLSYRRFQQVVAERVGKVYTLPACERSTRREASALWRQHTQKLLDGASREECVSATFANDIVCKPANASSLVTK
jgi:hypothetical protein